MMPYLAGNRLIDALPASAREALVAHASVIPLRSSQITHEPSGNFPWVVFPIDAVLSVISTTLAGETCEVGTIGNEGASGLDVALGAKIRRTTVCQIAGSAAIVPIGRLVEIVRTHADAAEAFRASEFARTFFIEQLVVCNTLHLIEKRCARWILAMADRRKTETIIITHEYLSFMLGVRRPSVTLAESNLTKRGAIVSGRGKLQILDRPLLESLACECYAATAATFDETISERSAPLPVAGVSAS